MAQLRVFTFCSYLCGDIWAAGGPTLQDSYRALKFIDALKRKPVNGWADVPVPFGQPTRELREANKAEAFAWFGEIVAAALGCSGLCRLVPVPGSKCVSRADVLASNTYDIASEIAKHFPMASVAPLLWWRQPMASASTEGGPRRAEELLPHLILDGGLKKPDCVLVDDVRTSGGHLQACEACLFAGGIEVRSVLCAGRTVYDEAITPFSCQEEKLERYRP